MKKQTKIITLVLSLALLVGSVIGISVSAETTEPSISIESYNVSFSGELHLFYAVNTSNVAKEGAEVTKTGIKLSLDPTTVADREIFEATASTEKYKDTDYPTFYSFGIPAKNLDDVIYATPYAEYSESTTVTGEEVPYSVLEYCYQMVLVDAGAAYDAGTITANKCYTLKNALRSLLAYGEDVQKYFAYETSNLPSDYSYVAVKGGTLNDGGTIFCHNTALPADITLAHTAEVPAGKLFVGWKATYFDGSSEDFTAESSSAVNPASSVVYSPIYRDKVVTTFESLDPNLGNVVNTNNTTDGSFIFDTAAADPTGAANKCLKATIWMNAYNTTTVTTNTTKVTNGAYTDGDVCTGNAFRFETDIYIPAKQPNSTTATQAMGIPFQFAMKNASGDNIGSYTIYLNDGSGTYANPIIRVRQNYGDKAYILAAEDVGFDEWFNISFTYYRAADDTTLTGMLITITAANGTEYTCFDAAINDAYTAAYGSTSAVSSANISWYKTSTHRDVYLDNIYLTTLESETYTAAAE